MSERNALAILELLKEVEEEDPIDYGMVSCDEEELRRMAAMGIAQILQDSSGMTKDEQLLILAASAAKLSLENMVLHMQLRK